MVKIDEDQTTIRITKGDTTGKKFNKIAVYCPYYENGEEKLYEFQPDDKLAFVVHPKKGYTKDEILRVEGTLREFGYTEPTTTPEIYLTEEDTKKFPLTNKPITYWYDVVLNDSTTIIGYDEDGAKKCIVYPEAEED